MASTFGDEEDDDDDGRCGGGESPTLLLLVSNEFISLMSSPYSLYIKNFISATSSS
jgi:hypothetical protein